MNNTATIPKGHPWLSMGVMPINITGSGHPIDDAEFLDVELTSKSVHVGRPPRVEDSAWESEVESRLLRHILDSFDTPTQAESGSAYGNLPDFSKSAGTLARADFGSAHDSWFQFFKPASTPAQVELLGVYTFAVSYALLGAPSASLSFKDIDISLKYSGFHKCAERIGELLSADDIGDDEPLSLESAQGFVEFMKNFPDLGEPMLGLFPKGTLSAEWRIAHNKMLLVEPLNSEKVSFAFIGPSTDPKGEFRLNGRDNTIIEVVNTLRQQGVAQWRNA